MARVGGRMGFRQIHVDSRIPTRVSQRVSFFPSRSSANTTLTGQVVWGNQAITWGGTPITWGGE